MVTIKRYCENEKNNWNAFNRTSKMPLFMFDRDYMDYHKARFTDHSLMFYENDTLIALLPMSEKSNVLISHGGLTYGSFITDNGMKQHIMNECFDVLHDYITMQGFDKLIYKSIPYIYHMQPAEEDRYALFLHHAKLKTVEAATVINLDSPLRMAKGRKAQISRARREEIKVVELFDRDDFDRFIDLENDVLLKRHGARAVHTGAEMALLHSRFPENIHLFCAIDNGKMTAGAIVFEYLQVLHTQYLAANESARKNGALDLVIATIIDRYKDSKKWLDFGKSTEKEGTYLNEGLISQKEGFGGRTVVYDTWQIDALK